MFLRFESGFVKHPEGGWAGPERPVHGVLFKGLPQTSPGSLPAVLGVAKTLLPKQLLQSK